MGEKSTAGRPAWRRASQRGPNESARTRQALSTCIELFPGPVNDANLQRRCVRILDREHGHGHVVPRVLDHRHQLPEGRRSFD
eukprot:2707312-Pyramimonas_sp.AAC.1